jgi:hypothetical protein
MKNIYLLILSILLLVLLPVVTACGAAASPLSPQHTVTISAAFQSQSSPVPTTPAYICGAWSSNNVPGTYSSLSIYARLTQNLVGVPGATAKATVHFRSFDTTLDQQPVSDNGGYVTFTLALQGRQPALIAATVDVAFQLNNTIIPCTQAFFTPL